MAGNMAAPYWRSQTPPRARLLLRSSNTSSLAQPRITTAKAQAVPTAPAPMIPVFMILLIPRYKHFDRTVGEVRGARTTFTRFVTPLRYCLARSDQPTINHVGAKNGVALLCVHFSHLKTLKN